MIGIQMHNDTPLEKDEILSKLTLESQKQGLWGAEDTKPAYYKYELNGAIVDVFDIAKAMGLPNTLFMALKYFRIKGDKNKRINDLEKAIECIQREIEYLKKN